VDDILKHFMYYNTITVLLYYNTMRKSKSEFMIHSARRYLLNIIITTFQLISIIIGESCRSFNFKQLILLLVYVKHTYHVFCNNKFVVF